MDQKNVKLTDVSREQKWSQRTSKPYEAVRLRTVEFGDRFLSGFGNEDNKSWQVGDEVALIITESQKTDRTGRPYLNFETVKKQRSAAPQGGGMPVEVVKLLTAMKLEIDVIYKHVLGRDATKAADEAMDAALRDEGPADDILDAIPF